VKQLLILAGGMGKRLQARLGDLPKPMIPIAGQPLLEHQIRLAQNYGLTTSKFSPVTAPTSLSTISETGAGSACAFLIS